MPAPQPAAASSAAANILQPRGAPSRSPAEAARALGEDDTFYPSSDGKPMAENMWQARAIMNAASDLEEALPNALVAADILLYPEKGNNRNSIAPDVLVAFDLGTHERMNYRVWEEGKPPDWVLEVASPSTEDKDRIEKRCRYAAMGVPEYWLFDAKGDVYKDDTPRLLGLELVGDEYSAIKRRLVAGQPMIRSEALGLDVYVDGKLLRFRYPATGQLIQHRPEITAAAERAEARASAAEARVAELEAALRRLRESPPQ